MNYSSSGYPSSYQVKDVSQYASGQPIHDNEHLPQIARLIQDVINEAVPPMVEKIAAAKCQEIMRRVVPSMIEAMRTDITTIVNIAFEQGAAIWSDSRTQTYISDNIMKAVEERLNDIVISIDLL